MKDSKWIDKSMGGEHTHTHHRAGHLRNQMRRIAELEIGIVNTICICLYFVYTVSPKKSLTDGRFRTFFGDLTKFDRN